MSDTFKGYAAMAKGGRLEAFEWDSGELGPEQVEVAVEYCGICHSDLSMLDNEWGMTQYPFVGGHEVIGTVVARGDQAKRVNVGQRVGIGWTAASCTACKQCLSGDQHLCRFAQGTIVHRHGGFADRVRAQWQWVLPLPEGLDVAKSGPLLCGGVTVFSPMFEWVNPTDRVGVIGIGGLGHMALRFLSKWGCEVYAFTSSEAKREEAKRLGAHQVINSRDSAQMKSIAGALDYVLVTVNVPLDWKTIIETLAPRGRLHFAGAVLEPVPVDAMSLITGQRVISGAPTGSPARIATMLDFCARHDILPVTEEFGMSKVNEAFDHLRAGKARYRIVLKNDA